MQKEQNQEAIRRKRSLLVELGGKQSLCQEEAVKNIFEENPLESLPANYLQPIKTTEGIHQSFPRTNKKLTTEIQNVKAVLTLKQIQNVTKSIKKMINLNKDFKKAIRHFNRKIQTENGFEKTEKYLLREKILGRERRHRSDELSDVFNEKIETLADEAGKTIAGGCEGPEAYLRGAEDDFQVYCDWNNDTVLCWPRTLAGTTTYLPCFEEYNGVKYDSSENATRHCFENGTWSSSNYSLCLNIETTISESAFDDSITGLTSMLYYIGYSISVVALLIAMFIFLYFKDLRCLRNTIHTNLMFTYVMADFMWILTGILQNSLQADMTMCMVLPLMLHYFHVTTFFWMFVEGFYLYMLVVETFNRANIKAFVYVSIGWGIPLLLIIIWGVVKALAPLHQETAMAEFSGVLSHCHWMNGTIHDWIFKVPVLTVMALNSVFLVMIMWVLITKLRSANNAETQQYRKATKALLVLIPLLGITYILTIVSPTEGIVAQVFYNTRAFMLSFQGFLVALFYCFLNSEVQNTVRHHMESWRTARTLGDKRYNYSRDWSPRSRTESVRLYSQPTITQYKKRESCASEVTTTTVVNSTAYSNNGNRVSNGSTSGTSIAAAPKQTTPFLSRSVENDD